MINFYIKLCLYGNFLSQVPMKFYVLLDVKFNIHQKGEPCFPKALQDNKMGLTLIKVIPLGELPRDPFECDSSLILICHSHVKYCKNTMENSFIEELLLYWTTYSFGEMKKRKLLYVENIFFI